MLVERQTLDCEFDSAVDELKRLFDRECRLAMARGYTWYSTSEAPETWNELRKVGKVIPIADYGSDKSIYGKEYNTMFRFWHDVLHLEYDKGFSLEDEIFIADKHIEAGRIFGLSTLALRILQADTMGQVLYYYKHKKFIDNQQAFVQTYINRGRNAAVLNKH